MNRPGPPIDVAAPEGIRRSATKGVAWSLVQSWGGRLVSTAAFVILARTLGPDDFGVVALAVIFIDLGQMLINRGFGASIVQNEDLTDEDLDSAFWFSLAVGTALALAFVLAAGAIGDAFNEPQLAPVLRVLSLNWVFGALSSVPQSLLQRQLRFRSLAMRRLIAVTAGGTTGVLLALGGAGVWSLVAMALVQSAVGVAVLWSVSPWRPRWRVSLTRLRAMRRFAASVVVIDFIRFFIVRGEAFVIGAVIGPVSLGYYAVATRFLTLLNEVFTSTIGLVAFPVFSRLQGQHERRRRALLSVVRMTSMAAFPAFILLALLAPEIIAVVLGPQWAPSVVLTQLLALVGLRFAVSYFLSNVVLSTGNAGLELRVTIYGALIKAASVAIGLQWGVVGVAWAVVVSSYVTLPIGLWALRRTTGITAGNYLRQVAHPAFATVVMALAVVGSRALLQSLGDAAIVLGCGAIGAVVYLITLGIVAPELFRDARIVIQDLLRRRSTATSSAVPS